MARSPATKAPPDPLAAIPVDPTRLGELLPSASLDAAIQRVRARSDLERLYDTLEVMAAAVQVAGVEEDWKNLPKLAAAHVLVHQAIHGAPEKKTGARPGRGEHDPPTNALHVADDAGEARQSLDDTLKALGVPRTALGRGPAH